MFQLSCSWAILLGTAKTLYVSVYDCGSLMFDKNPQLLHKSILCMFMTVVSAVVSVVW